LRAIAYFRVGDENSKSQSYSENDFRQYCLQNMHQPVTTFVSIDNEGGSEKSGYRRMIEYLQGSDSEFLVVVPNAKHLGPDLESVVRSILQLDSLRAKVTCSDDEFPDPLQNAFQTLGIKGVSRTRSRRIKESMQARALQGQAMGKPLYGYRIGPDGLLEVVRDEAVVVELIFRLYINDGLGLRLIVQHLNEREIPTRRGGRWNVVSVRDILKNPAYTGTYTRFGMRRPKTHEAIIAADLFRAAQDQTRSRRPMGRVMNPEPFLLSGVLYCGYCGNKMMGVTRRQSWKRKDGRIGRQVYKYYQCQSRNNQSLCDYHTWRASMLESTVYSHLKYALPAKAAEHGDVDRDEARALRETAVRNAERRFLQATKRAARADIRLSVLGEYLREMDAARRAVKGEVDLSDIESVLTDWDSLDMDARRDFLTEHVARIDVKDDRVEVIV